MHKTQKNEQIPVFFSIFLKKKGASAYHGVFLVGAQPLTFFSSFARYLLGNAHPKTDQLSSPSHEAYKIIKLAILGGSNNANA